MIASTPEYCNRVLPELLGGRALSSGSVSPDSTSSIEGPLYTDADSFLPRPTTRLFSAAPFDPTRLSPFYYRVPPDIEACNMDMEAEAIICALRRLSHLPAVEMVSAQDPNLLQQPEDVNDSLAADCDAFVTSLLFRPDGGAGFRGLNPAVAPNSSRAWTSAAYLYLHLIVEPWRQKGFESRRVSRECPFLGLGSLNVYGSPAASSTADLSTRGGGSTRSGAGDIDRNLMLWLLSTLRDHIDAVEPAVRMGRACPDLYMWMLTVCVYSALQASATFVPLAQASSASARAAGPPLGPMLDPHHELAADWLPWARRRLGAWSRLRRTTDWVGVRRSLERTAWPTGDPEQLETVEEASGLRRVWLESVGAVVPASSVASSPSPAPAGTPEGGLALGLRANSSQGASPLSVVDVLGGGLI